jgi:hypothetical protein
MKQLIWKELREQRYIPIALGALVIAVIAAWYTVSAILAIRNHDPNGYLTANTTTVILLISLCLLGIFPASGAVAPEIGKGTFQFLTTLPGGRSRLWRAKVSAGLITMAVSLVSGVICYVAVMLVIYGPDGLISAGKALSLLPHPAEQAAGGKFSDQAVTVLLMAAYGYAVCFFASTLVDRSMVATVLGLIGGIAVLVPFLSWATMIPQISYRTGVSLECSVIAGLTAIFAAASYVGFCSGNAGIVKARMKRGLTAAATGLAVMLVTMLTCQTVMARAYAAQQALLQKSMPRITYHQTRVSGTYWNHLETHAVFPHDNRRGIGIDVMLVNPRQSLRQLTDARSTSRLPPGSFYENYTLTRNAGAGAYVDPVSISGGNAFFQANLIQPDCVEIALHRQQLPGTSHDTVRILDKNGRSLGVIKIENVTL